MSVIKFNSTFEYKLIYIFRINDKEHAKCIKIGDTTLHTNKSFTDFAPNCHELNYAARTRIDSYTSTAGIHYELLHTEIAICEKEGKLKAFRDYKVHEVLIRSGIKKKIFEFDKKASEWFICDLSTAINAIDAVKKGMTSLNASKITNDRSPIIFRPEQREAIKKTISRYKSDTRMLWNAKMRFGKTLTALEVAKEMNFKRTIIITHRPVVSKGWFEDFDKIFYDREEYYFGSKTGNGKTLTDLLQNDNSFVFFASMQDLRGSDAVGGNFDKNDDIFKINWDFVVVDEAHEGTKTTLGKNVLEAVIKPNNEHKTYVLELSGTPFNLLTDFEKESIYTWDYIMEQEAKNNWDQLHLGDSNPYEELPSMNIFTYHLEKSLPVYVDIMDKAFNFKEFFKLWTGDVEKDRKPLPKNTHIGDFVYEDDINAFLNLICKESQTTNYPYSTKEYRDFFRHSLWVVPGVKEAKALENLLNKHHILKEFKIVNVAGDGGDEIDTSDALNALRNEITDHPENTRTITLSCGRLTTGVTVPEWTAVLMLSGTYSTAASQYLQTIFRVQSPANINGKMKKECYVFDFAPDRTLKMIAESVQLSARAGANNSVAEQSLQKFLNYCPVIAIEDSNMKEYKVSELLQELKKAYAERVARNGFDDPKIYNDELLKLTELELKEFEDLKKIIGASKQTKKAGEIDINNEGFNEEETEEEKNLKDKKRKKELSEEEKKRLEELKEKRKNRDSAISILRAISIRMPLLVYGMDIDIDVDVTIDNFADLIDDTSWKEFMPDKVDKSLFKKFSKYYDKDIFIAASRKIRYIAKTADELEPTERVIKIASLFATFKNPDKETVLTPWRVVNMHMSNTIGGYTFFDDSYENILDEPKFISYDTITNNIFNSNAKILEMNSKTGLYPLYLTYSLYKNTIQNNDELDFDKKIEIWDEVIKNQIFIICKTPMAKLITKRTLLGYRKGKINTHSFDDLVMQLKDKQTQFIQKVLKPSFWNLGGNGEMKFNAIVGNPPYQLQGGSGGSNDAPIYQYFVDMAIKLNPNYASIIMPARWGAAGRENLLGDFRKNMLSSNFIRKMHLYTNARDIFDNVEIKGGICYILLDIEHPGTCEYSYFDNNKKYFNTIDLSKFDILIRDPMLSKIVKTVKTNSDNKFIDSLISNDTPFGISSNVKSSTKNSFDIATKKDNKYDIALYHIEKMVRKKEYISSKSILKNAQDIDKYKVLLTGAAGSGSDPIVLGKPVLADKGSVCSQSYLYIPFDTKHEASNFIKYLNTKFFRCLVASIKITQSCPNRVYKFVPLQNFDYNSDIDWNLSIEEIDNYLYKKYKLDCEDIKYINSKFDYFK